MYSKADLTIWGMTLKIMREEGGVRGLYRGLVTTAVGVAPYVGINFAAYELLRSVITPPGKNNVVRKLSCGALAGEYTSFLTRWFVVMLIILSNFRNSFADLDISLRRVATEDAGYWDERWRYKIFRCGGRTSEYPEG